MTMPTLRDILNDTPANAIDVDWNFGVVEQHVNTEVIARDGSVAMTSPLSLSGLPTAPQHAASKAYVDQGVIPVGTIWQFAGGPGTVGAPQTVPAGWAICDGSSKTTTDPAYAPLFAVIGYTYGGAGVSFNLPNLQGRIPAGRQATDAMFDVIGKTAGSKDAAVVTHSHTLMNHTHAGETGGELQDHTHPMPHAHTIDHDHGSATSSVSGAHAHTLPTMNNNTAGINAAQGGNNTGGVTNQATDVAGDHSHTVDLPNFTGSSGGPSSPSTSGRSNLHAHGFNTLGPNVDSTSPSGSPAANANLQPYIVLNFIIRIG